MIVQMKDAGGVGWGAGAGGKQSQPSCGSASLWAECRGEGGGTAKGSQVSGWGTCVDCAIY